VKSRAITLRRALCLAGATFVAALVAVAIPSPASAHHPIIEGQASCQAATGTWIVTWTVKNSEYDLAGTLTEVTVSPGTVTNIVVGATLPKATEPPLVGVQTLSGDATQAALKVTAFWKRPTYTTSKSEASSVELRGSCRIPLTAKPAATFASHCDETVTATLINGADANTAAMFKVTAAGGFAKTAKVDPSGSVTIDIPAANASTITVKSGYKTVAVGKFEDPTNCAIPQTTVAKTCDAISLSVSNPDTGRVVTGSLAPNAGDAVAFTLKPGEEKSNTFAGTEGLTVAMKVTGLPDETVAWTKPASCTPPPPPPATPGLPNTGSNLTAAISSGAGLVAVGAVILFFFRRRRGAHARF